MDIIRTTNKMLNHQGIYFSRRFPDEMTAKAILEVLHQKHGLGKVQYFMVPKSKNPHWIIGDARFLK